MTNGLRSWRSVICPHNDVLQDTYKKSEFAADLWQVSRGEGSIEYRDPAEFFRRTYITEGLRDFLVQALRRVTGRDGEPVIQLKTAFGGGKTHSMLALYHLMKGGLNPERVPAIRPVLNGAGISSLPEVNVAVLVGTAISPAEPSEVRGLRVNTLWGNMAAQIGGYDYVREADAKGVSPGSDAMRRMFDACGPCMVLIDELVAYGRKLEESKGLIAGTFGNLLSFIQEITEAAKGSKNSVVVATIPESDMEAGGDKGRKVLHHIEHTFGRLEAIWKPVAASEGFEIVRRRLFLECQDDSVREDTADAFSRMYRENPGDFPVEARDSDYRERIISCYPIHPEIFDRLYGDWATLEKFQRTRGVLRLMAAVIHALWTRNDSSALIMPGSIPLDVPKVREELIRNLGEGWNGIVDGEVDGVNSIPYKKDNELSRFGSISAARRTARAIMLGSAPTSRAQAVRGIEASRIRLGVVQPGESIAVINDAMNTLQASLSYLYTNMKDNRYWYDNRPTLRKVAEERAGQIPDSDIRDEIYRRLVTLRAKKPFAGVHVWQKSQDIPDGQELRLVVLAPEQDGVEILESRGKLQRVYRNMLVFLSADTDQLETLRDEVRQFLAWQSIKQDVTKLNLDRNQEEETNDKLKHFEDAVSKRIPQTWRNVMIPYTDREGGVKAVHWEKLTLSGEAEIVGNVIQTMMKDKNHMITELGADFLMMEVCGLYFENRDEIGIKTLWEDLCKYCYFPRLTGYEVLEGAVKEGVRREIFALADGGNGSLKFGEYVGAVNGSDYIVKKETALTRLKKEEPVTPGVPATETARPHEPQKPREPELRRFHLTVPLDIVRIKRDLDNINNEIIAQIASFDGADANISLDIEITTSGAIPKEIIRAVNDNCLNLKITDFGFEE